MDRVRMVFTKWGGRPHWEYDARLLGEDGHGVWLGLPRGSTVARPGARITTSEDQVVLVPSAHFVATFYAPGGAPCDVYVDISTVAEHQPGLVSAVDLDLDVLRARTGRVWVDDEDEFADHRVRYAYPEEVVRAATASCVTVRTAVERAEAPFDRATPAHWLGMLGQRMMDR